MKNASFFLLGLSPAFRFPMQPKPAASSSYPTTYKYTSALEDLFGHSSSLIPGSKYTRPIYGGENKSFSFFRRFI